MGRPSHHDPHGRGARENAAGRFESLRVEVDEDAEIDAYADDPRPLTTQFFRDDSQSIVTENRSPDLSFDRSLNPYRGCEHGCAYCYARPYHEYLGFSAGLDFESKILVKPAAAELLRAHLSKPRYVPDTLVMSGVTDCYQPVERKLRITRSCLETLRDFRHPVAVITKNALVARDADLLGELAGFNAAAAALSVTTLDAGLARHMEPRASAPAARLRAIRELTDAGVPAGVSLAPVIPGLNDHEIPALLQAAADAGAVFATYTVVRLPYSVKDLFSDWLERFFPDRREKILSRIRDLRGGDRLNDSDFGTRFTGVGTWAAHIESLFRSASRKAGFTSRRPSLSAAAFRKTDRSQPELF